MKRYFKLFNQHYTCWGNKDGFTLVSVEQTKEPWILEIKEIKGMKLARNGLLALLQKFYQKELNMAYSLQKREYKYYKKRIKEGVSGSKTLYLSTLQNDLLPKWRTVLCISCADKIDNIRVNLMDLIIFIPDIYYYNGYEYSGPDTVTVKEIKPANLDEYTDNSVETENDKIIQKFIDSNNYNFMYIIGVHPEDENKTQYTWIVPDNLKGKVQIGKRAIVDTCYGESEIEIVEVITTNIYTSRKDVIKILEP